jgi:hypothetical protein
MIHLIRDLYNLGLRIGTDLFSETGVYYTVEITETEPKFKIQEDAPVLNAPFREGRTSGVKPYHLHDNLKYFLRMDKRGNTFWDLLISDIKEIGNPELTEAINTFVANSKCWKSEVAYPGRDAKETYWFVWLKKKPTKVEVKKKLTNPVKGPPNAVSDSAWIVPSFKGTPITNLPEVIAWWEAKSTKQMTDNSTGSSFDLVTGKRCTPVSLHAKVKGVPKTGGAFPLVSFNEPTYCFDGMEQGMNFPIADSTSRTYTSGLNFLLDRDKSRSSVQVADDLVVMFWPKQAEKFHPIIDPACKILGDFLKKEELDKSWENLEAVDSNDQTELSFLLLKGAQARISVLDYRAIKVAKLKENLLKFKEDFATCRPSLRTMTAFKREERGKAMIPPASIPAIIQCVVFGTKVPVHLIQYLNVFPLSEDSASYILTWNDAACRRMGYV